MATCFGKGVDAPGAAAPAPEAGTDHPGEWLYRRSLRDEADRPLAKQSVEVRVANATRLAGLEGEARLTGLPRGGAWEEFGLRARSDDQGRVLLPWQIPDEVRERLGEEQYWRLDATAEIALWGAVRAEADAPPTQPILLRVPSTGTLELELQDFPPGVVPQLVAAEDPHARSLYARQEDLGPVFRFEGVPVAASLRAFFLLREIDPDTQRERLTQRSIPDRLIRGPEAPQQLTRRVLRYERQPGIYGKLILPEHRREAIASTSSSVSGFSVRGLADRLNYPVQELAFDFYPDGSFHISPRPRYSEGEVKWSGLDHLVFEWLPRSFRINDPGPQEERRSLFATVPLQLDGEESHIELGEVTLVEEPYLLHITVLDEQGEPVPGAHVWVERGYEPDRGRAPSRSASPGYLNADQNGECWIQDHDWHSEFGTAPADSRHNHQGAIPFLHVHARREGYAPAMVEIPPSQREVEVRLAAAGSAEGGMRWAEGAHYVQMHWMPVGAPVDDWATGAVARWVGQAMHLNPEDGITSFELDSIPTGQWDVVFSVGIRPSMEAIRIPRVEVRAGEVCRDPRLQEVDLVSTVASYRVKLQDPAGKPVIPPDFRGRLLVRQSEQAFRELARLHWRQGEFLLARPLGVPLEAYLVDDRWLSLDLTGLRPGSHRLTVHPRRDQPVDCGLASPLPDGQLLSVSLQSLQPPRRTSYLTLDASGKGTVQLPAPAFSSRSSRKNEALTRLCS